MSEEKKISVGDSFSTSDVERMIVEAAGGKLKLPQVHESLNLFKQVVCDLVSKGAKIMIPGFMVISSMYKPERNGINTFTNEPFTTPEKAIPHIRIGNKLKEAALQIQGDTLQQLKAMKK